MKVARKKARPPHIQPSAAERERIQEENDKSKGGFLTAAFRGPLEGRLGQGFPGVILARQPGLDSRIVRALFHSFGSLEDLQLVDEDDTTEFDVEVDDPTHPAYRPFFFNRKSEYGQDHAYYEALCHSHCIDSSDPEDHIIDTASARYADRREARAIGSRLVPATVEVNALVDALHETNAEFLDHLREALASAAADDTEATITPELARRFVDGAWRNCAVQFHFNGESYSVLRTLHLDHINSSLHMAVTLNGQRTVGFVASEWWPDGALEIEMAKGDVYLTSPTAIFHGIGVKESSEEMRSVALQLRTLLSVEDANALQQTEADVRVLLRTVLQELDRFEGRIRMPTWDEWEHHRQQRLKLLQQVDNGEGSRPGKVIFHNVFKPSTQ